MIKFIQLHNSVAAVRSENNYVLASVKFDREMDDSLEFAKTELVKGVKQILQPAYMLTDSSVESGAILDRLKRFTEISLNQEASQNIKDAAISQIQAHEIVNNPDYEIVFETI